MPIRRSSVTLPGQPLLLAPQRGTQAAEVSYPIQAILSAIVRRIPFSMKLPDRWGSWKGEQALTIEGDLGY